MRKVLHLTLKIYTMKKLLLFLLLPFLSLAQININKVCDFTQEEAKSYVDEIVSLAKEPFRFYKIAKGIKSEVFIYVPSNISDATIGTGPHDYMNYETIEVVYRVHMEGKNDNLKIPGVKRYLMERAYGKFLNLFPFWQKYYVLDATIENYKEDQKREFKKGQMLMKFSDNNKGYWLITTFYCP